MTLQARHRIQAARRVRRVRRSTESAPSTWPQGKRKRRRPARPDLLEPDSDAGRPIATSLGSLYRLGSIPVGGRLGPGRDRGGHSRPDRLDP